MTYEYLTRNKNITVNYVWKSKEVQEKYFHKTNKTTFGIPLSRKDAKKELREWMKRNSSNIPIASVVNVAYITDEGVVNNRRIVSNGDIENNEELLHQFMADPIDEHGPSDTFNNLLTDKKIYGFAVIVALPPKIIKIKPPKVSALEKFVFKRK